MQTSDSDLKVNRNIYPDAVTCDRMRLIGPKCDQLGTINIVYLKNPNEKTSSFCLHKTGFLFTSQARRNEIDIGGAASEAS